MPPPLEAARRRTTPAALPPDTACPPPAVRPLAAGPAGEGRTEVGRAEHDDDPANHAGNQAERDAPEHPRKTDRDNAEHRERLAERAEDEGADVVDHRRGRSTARHGLGIR